MLSLASPVSWCFMSHKHDGAGSVIEVYSNLSPMLYIPLESARVEVVDIDLQFADEVQPRRYPRLCKCVSMERPVPELSNI